MPRPRRARHGRAGGPAGRALVAARTIRSAAARPPPLSAAAARRRSAPGDSGEGRCAARERPGSYRRGQRNVPEGMYGIGGGIPRRHT
ncbi:hypothetical protein SVIO_079110 [Streptomyces violaceusniger]|uniref:Uncharacterized protein n=1 Tax=Streptomyces violaceusniger TaxID=68280 RepID=A0A4D4LFJ1_STRVO|nr:hypothetical protein SVIO_079110 [Streptomyces violaceusniger]